MGLGQSSQEDKHAAPISSRFSSAELTRLEQNFKHQGESKDTQQWNYDNIKERIMAGFEESVSTKIVNFIHMKAIAKGEGKIAPEMFMRFVFYLTKDSIRELAQTVYYIAGEGDEIVTRKSMHKFLTGFVASLQKGSSSEMESKQFLSSAVAGRQLVDKLVEHFPDNMKEADFDIMLHRTPLLIDVLQYKFRIVFFDYVSEISKESEGTLPHLIPRLQLPKSAISDTFLLSLSSAIYLNSQLPVAEQHKWRLLYSSKLHGESFSKMTGTLIGVGPTLIVVKDTSGYLFGGYASTSWRYSSQFQGTNKSFLFTVEPSLAVYKCAGDGYNNHFMYLNIGQETMPNGLGMGGQHDFFGLWLDHEFGRGHSRAKPACTTYGSPQLSKDEEFRIEAVTVWGVGEEPASSGENDEYDESMTSVLDKHVEAKALLEIAGKPRVSEGLRDIEPDADIPGTKELQHAHDPMS